MVFAAQVSESAGDNSGKAKRFYRQGVKLEQSGDSKTAVSKFDRAIEFDPDFVDAYLARGQARWKLGKSKEAEADFARAIELDPSDSIAYYARGKLRQRRRKLEGTLSDFTTAISLTPERGSLYLESGKTRYHLRDFSGAMSDLKTPEEILSKELKAIGGFISDNRLTKHQLKYPDVTTRRRLAMAPAPYASYERYWQRDHLEEKAALGEIDANQSDLYAARRRSQRDLKETYLLRAQVEIARGNRKAAMADFARVMGGAEHELSNGFFQFVTGNHAEAVNLFERVIENGNRAGKYLEYPRIWLSLAWAQSGQRAEAEQLSAEFLEKRSKSGKHSWPVKIVRFLKRGG